MRFLIVEPFNRAGLEGQLIATTTRRATAQAAFARGAHVSVSGFGSSVQPLVPVSKELLDISASDCNLIVLTDAQLAVIQDALAFAGSDMADELSVYLDKSVAQETR